MPWLAELYSRIVYTKYHKYIITVCITETLRKYPILPFLDRVCVKDWKCPDSPEDHNVTIPRGTGFYTPVYGIHHDPQYYPDPDKFDPERFTQENVKTRHQFTYLPFGEGPRICLGEIHKHKHREFAEVSSTKINFEKFVYQLPMVELRPRNSYVHSYYIRSNIFIQREIQRSLARHNNIFCLLQEGDSR